MPLPNPVIIVPGITATDLDDRYPLPPETIWSVLARDYDRAALHPDDTAFEAREPALVRGGRLFEIVYRELIEELRFNLRDREDQPIPVFPFSYDWRQPLETAAQQLGSFIDEAIERTKLLRHYDRDGYGERQQVNLIGHSMGGLVIASYVEALRDRAKVDRVATLATPFRGSFEAVIKIATGTANLGISAPSSREREAARVTPALYYLLPDIPETLEVAPGIPPDLFNPDAWQPSIVETISEFIRLHGLRPGDRRTRSRELFGSLLGAAQSGRSRLRSMDLSEVGLSEDRWLCIVGVNAETRVRLRISKRGRSPEFEFRTADRQNKWESTVQSDRMETGDGTVPLLSAFPHFLPRNRIVCVQPRDFGYWEIVDRAALVFGGFHGILPNMDMLHRMIVRFLKNRPDPHQNTWGMPAPGVDEADWTPPLRGGLRIRR